MIGQRIRQARQIIATSTAVFALAVPVTAVGCQSPEDPQDPLRLTVNTLYGADSVVYSPDGKFLATVNGISTPPSRRVDGVHYARHLVQLHDASSPTDSAKSIDWPGSDASMDAASFSLDGKLLAIAGDDGPSRERMVRMPDGDWTYSYGGVQGVVRLRDIATGKWIATLTDLSETTITTVALWDVATRKVLYMGVPFHGEERPAGWVLNRADFVTFSPDGKTLAATMHSGVLLWDVVSHERVDFLSDSGGSPFERTTAPVAFSPNGRLVATVGIGGSDSVRIWDVPNYKLFATLAAGTTVAHHKAQGRGRRIPGAASSLAFRASRCGGSLGRGSSRRGRSGR
jgi:WD40 repeat protein